MKWMRTLAIFVAGSAVGAVAMQTVAAQESSNTGLRLNHVGIAVEDVGEAIEFYTKVMGFRVAFEFPSPDGRPTTTYLQINRDTFLEVAPANADRAAGTISHIGIQAENADATIARLRQGGATVTDPRVSSNSRAKLANVTDPNGIRLELNELVPGSLARQAVESWR